MTAPCQLGSLRAEMPLSPGGSIPVSGMARLMER